MYTAKSEYLIFYGRRFNAFFKVIANQAIYYEVPFDTYSERFEFIKHVFKGLYYNNPTIFGYCYKCNPLNIFVYLN